MPAEIVKPAESAKIESFKEIAKKLLQRNLGILTVGLIEDDVGYLIKIEIADDSSRRDEKKIERRLSKFKRFHFKGFNYEMRFEFSNSFNFLESNTLVNVDDNLSDEKIREGLLDERRKNDPNSIPVKATNFIWSSVSCGNLQWLTNGTITGILEASDGQNPLFFLLSIDHVLTGGEGDTGDYIIAPTARRMIGEDFRKNIVGKVDFRKEPQNGIEWAIGQVKHHFDPDESDNCVIGILPSIPNILKIPKYQDSDSSDRSEIEIGDLVAAYGPASGEILYGRVQAIQVYASTESRDYLLGFEIERIEKPVLSRTSEPPKIDPMNESFGRNGDSGALVLPYDPIQNEIGNNPIGILTMVTYNEESDDQFGFAIYFDKVWISIKEELKANGIDLINFVEEYHEI